jgi:FtsP/CotA-like multicopper oxidase with cupredoxin domain
MPTLVRRWLLLGALAAAGLLVWYALVGQTSRASRKSAAATGGTSATSATGATSGPAQLAAFGPIERGAATLRNQSTEPGVVRVSLVAEPARLRILDEHEADVYLYNGRLPGPTLELREGDRVTVRFRNDLPEPTTVHWHGLHLPIDSDGSPLDPVAPGQERTYAFDVPIGSAGTYWYHPHPHHATGRQIALGLYGAIIVRGADDPLPATLAERLLILSDNRFREDGSIDLPELPALQAIIDSENGREGDVLLVNGEVMPAIEIRSGEVQRWRIVNASAARVFRLNLPGHTFLHVGSDGGLFEHPVEVDELLLANAERAEVLVRGTGAPGSTYTAATLPYDRYVPQTRPADWQQPRALFSLRYTDQAPIPPVAIPATLRPVPALDPADATATRLVVMSQKLLNSQHFDHMRVDVQAKLGSTEIWVIENVVGMDHPFHLHGFQFQVLERNGVPEPFRSWKDTVNVPRHGTVKLIVRYDNHPGKWMFHCHILDHEDQGMMGVLEVN